MLSNIVPTSHSLLKRVCVNFLISGAVFLLPIGNGKLEKTTESPLIRSIPDNGFLSKGAGRYRTKNISKRKIKERKNVDR